MTVPTFLLTLKHFTLLTAMLLISACSSTVDTPVAIEKKPLISDQQLLLSLLNRPLPQDQLMMMQFAQQREQQTNLFAKATVSYINIRGDKTSDQRPIAPTIYSQLIYKDANAIMVGAPQ